METCDLSCSDIFSSSIMNNILNILGTRCLGNWDAISLLHLYPLTEVLVSTWVLWQAMSEIVSDAEMGGRTTQVPQKCVCADKTPDLPSHFDLCSLFAIPQNATKHTKNLPWSKCGHALFSGCYGMCWMIIFLTESNIILLCRLSLWSRIGSVRGPFYNQWTSDRKWILGATGWNWSYGIYTTSPAGVLILDWHVDA
jgi:hypothetical protein